VSPQLIRLLTVCLLLLIYVFFFRVLRAVWVSVGATRGPSGRRPRASRAATAPVALVVRTPESQQGTRYDLEDEITMGRAAGCAITLEDAYASQIHARVYRQEDGFLLEDLGSTNGTYLNRAAVTTAAPLRPGDQVQIGSTVFEAVT
jgi:pSer/pThr/pTyr-binding forkhead associated (FHA) protein